jgi:hypothetical protein
MIEKHAEIAKYIEVYMWLWGRDRTVPIHHARIDSDPKVMPVGLVRYFLDFDNYQDHILWKSLKSHSFFNCLVNNYLWGIH